MQVRKYKEAAISLIKDLRYIIPTILVTVMSFGFTINNAAINIDDTAFNVYYQGHMLIEQGRFAPALYNKIFHIYEYNPFFLNLCAVMLFFMSAVAFCALFKVVSKDKLHPLTYTVFSCFLISYPLMNEIFSYMTASFTICISFLLTAISLMIFNELIDNKTNWLYWILSILLLSLVISGYESFAAVYICGVFAILILKFMFAEKENETFKKILFNGLLSLIPLISGIIIKAVVSNILINTMGLTYNNLAETSIYYTIYGFGEMLKNLKDTLIVKYGINGLWYLPIAIYLAALIISLIMLIVYSVKYKKAVVILLFLGLYISTILISVIQGNATPYRACQPFAVFVAFIMMLTAHEAFKIQKAKILKYAVIAALCLTVFYQTKDLHQWFYLNYVRYNYEKNIVSSVSERLNYNCNTSKPVVFHGVIPYSPDVADKILVQENDPRVKIADSIAKAFGIKMDFKGSKFVQSNVNLFINWGNTAFEQPGRETVKFFRMNGYSFKMPTKAMAEEAESYLPLMSNWPDKNSIMETDKFIIVKFSN